MSTTIFSKPNSIEIKSLQIKSIEITNNKTFENKKASLTNKINSINLADIKDQNQNQNLSINKSSFLLDLICGTICGLGIAPIVGTIDKGIFQNASGVTKLSDSIKSTIKSITNKPSILFSVEYRYIFLIYFGTYFSCNLIESFCIKNKINSDSPKFIGISLTNMILTLKKDRAFVKLFGSIQPKKVPLRSYSMWFTRDTISIACSFIAPGKIAGFLNKSKNWSQRKSENIAQLFCPVLLQFISTPLHLLGMNYYNIEKNEFKKRLNFVKKEYCKSVGARMITCFPAYGIGGIVNNTFRKYFSESRSQ
jgi:hypothetical protein